MKQYRFVAVHGIPPSSAPELLQLPVERLMPQSIIQQSKEMCQMCELFLHYMQVEITNPVSEKEIKDFVKHACNNLPQSVRGQCDSFVDIYGDAFIAIIAQKIDPSQVSYVGILCYNRYYVICFIFLYQLE